MEFIYDFCFKRSPLDQIFRSANNPNGWTDRPVAEDTVREIYDLMKWRQHLRTAAPRGLSGCVAPTERQRSPGLLRNRISRTFYKLRSWSLSATIWISPANYQSLCLTLPRSCSSTLRHQA